jgi:hypothetical protein
MFFLTEDAVIVCQHERGIVQNVPSQDWVTIANRRVLVEIDPEGRTIKGCPNYGVGIRPCVTTLKVISGYSDLIRIDGRRLCLDPINGLTDGTPPGLVLYKVNEAGQPFVQETR